MDRFLKNLEDGLAGLVSGGISHEKIRPFRRGTPSFRVMVVMLPSLK